MREGWWVAKEGWLARAGRWLDMVELKLKGEQRRKGGKVVGTAALKAVGC